MNWHGVRRSTTLHSEIPDEFAAMRWYAYDPRRFAICRFALLSIGVLAISAVTPAAIAVGDPAEIVIDDELQQKQFDADEQSGCISVFGNASVPAARNKVEMLLRQKIAIVDRICGLTEAQRHALELSSRGEMKRLFDRIRNIGARPKVIDYDDAAGYEMLWQDAERLKRGLSEPGAPIEISLIDKSLERLLTAEQAPKYDPLRAIFRVGGLIQALNRTGPNAAFTVNLAGTACTDDELARIARFPGLRDLNLNRTNVTDRGLAHLGELVGLQSLALDGTPVTDGGVSNLKGAVGLQSLSLKNTAVTDASLRNVKEFVGLRCLHLDGTKVSDAGIELLKELTGLRELTLDNTPVTDVSLEHVAALPALCDLSLRRTRVTDAGLVQLNQSPSLEWLWLDNTAMTDKGLATLRKSTTLKHLFVRNAAVMRFESVVEWKLAIPQP